MFCSGGATRKGFVRLLSVTVAMTMSHGLMAFYAFFPNDEVNAQSLLLLENKLGTTDIPIFIVGRIVRRILQNLGNQGHSRRTLAFRKILKSRHIFFTAFRYSQASTFWLRSQASKFGGP